MSNENAKRDLNYRPTLLAITDDANQEIRRLLVDPTTGRLKCTAIITAGAGIQSLNGLTAATQLFATGSTGTDFNISSVTATHTFNIPTASATARGLLSTTDWGTFNAKVGSVATANGISGTVTLGVLTLTLGAITPSTVNGLTLTALATGFSIAGGTTSKTLTVSLDANVSGTNTGDVTLATDHGLNLTNQVLAMGTPSTCTAATTNAVSTTTHTHAITGFLTSVTAHNVLSTTHGDTTADSVVKGDVITGQGTPAKWTRLAFPGTPTGKVLQASATDVVWSTNPLTIGTSASVSGSNTGDQDLSGYALIGQTMYIGTTSHAINRASAAEGLTGITGLTPNADFTLTQNSVAAITSVESGAIVNTLYLKEGNVGIGTTAPGAKLDVAFTQTVAGGGMGIRSTIIQGTNALTGTLRAGYFIATNGNFVSSGVIRGIEVKARAALSDLTGGNVGMLEGVFIDADAKNKTVTILRGAEIIMDGQSGASITTAVGVRISNNFQANIATTSYGLQIYRDSFDYTADIQLSSGGLIGGLNGTLNVKSTGETFIDNLITKFPIIDARYYGAVGDGTTDDTTAISNMLQAYLVANAVFDGAGKTYKLTSTISKTLFSNVKWEIRNFTFTSATVSEPGSEKGVINLTGDETIAAGVWSGTNTLIIKDVSFIDSRVSLGNLDGITINNFNQVFLLRIKAIGYSGTGVLIESSKNVLVEQCFMTDNMYAGLRVGSLDGMNVIGGDYSSNGISAPTYGYGIASSAGDGVNITQHVLITGVISNNNLRSGINFHAGKDVKIIGNTIIGYGYNGIYAVAESGGNTIKDVVIADNFIDGSSNSLTGSCIQVGSSGLLAPAGGNFIIENNNIISGTIAGGNGSSAVFVNFPDTGSQGNSININNNHIFGSSSDAPIIDFHSYGYGNNFVEVKILNNIIHSVATTYAIRAVNIAPYVSIENNQIIVDSGTVTMGIALYNDPTVCNNIDNNQFFGSATYTGLITTLTVAGSSARNNRYLGSIIQDVGAIGWQDILYSPTVASGGTFGLRTQVTQDTNALTGTLRAGYFVATNGNLTSTNGIIRGVEAKARAANSALVGGTVGELNALYGSADAKNKTVTTMRVGYLSMDGQTGATITTAVGLRIANNFQANIATTSYGLQFYVDSFQNTADIQLSSGGLIGGSSGHLTIANTGVVTTTIGIVPDANDGAYLGTTALSFSDLFLALGGVINWNNGDVRLIHSAGELDINTATTKIITGSNARFVVTGPSAGILQIASTDDSAGDQTFQLRGYEFTFLKYLGGRAMYISSVGVVTIDNLAGTGSRAVLADANGVLSAPVSDARLKTNITPIDGSIAMQMLKDPNIYGINYQWADSKKGTDIELGFTAQQFEFYSNLIPGLTFEDNGIKGLNYDKLTVLLWEQNKILLKRIEELEVKLK
jgi:hypothetical protein